VALCSRHNTKIGRALSGAAFFRFEDEMIDDNIIINHILTTIGEGGVSSTNTLHPSVASAKRILNTEDVAFQGIGWWFNTEREVKLAVNEAGRVEAPQDVLEITVSYLENKSPAEKLRFVKRGKYIYDTYKHTNVLNQPVYVDMIVRLPVSDMPTAASNYLMHKCAETAYVADDGDTFKTSKLEKNRMEAWAQLSAKKLTIMGVSALDNPVAQSLRVYGGQSISFNRLDGGSQ
jgi:hypothetical protein